MKILVRQMVKCPVALGIAFLFCGCGSSFSEQSSEPSVLLADSIAVEQVVKPVQWAVCNARAVVVSENTDSVFYVYSLPDFEFLYTWGRYGGGPGEFGGRVRMTDCRDGDTGRLTVEDFRAGRFDVFSADSKGFSLRDTLKTFPDRRVFSEDKPLPCGFLATKKVPLGAEKEYLYIRDRMDGTVRDSVVLQTIVSAKYDQKGNMYELSRLNVPKLLARGNRLAAVYENIRHVDFYEVSPKGKLSLVGSVGETIDQAAIEKLNANRRSSSQRGIMGFAATRKFIYTLYLEIEFDWETKYADIRKKIVYVYDWDGNQVRAYDLEKPATDILVTADGKKLYTRNIQEDFDKVYVYDLD